MKLKGGCHCGNMTYSLEWPDETGPRAARICTCSFCTKHNIRYISHPEAALELHLRVLEGDRRPVSVTADQEEFRDVLEVNIEEDRSVELKLLFDPDHNLDERILLEQFVE